MLQQRQAADGEGRSLLLSTLVRCKVSKKLLGTEEGLSATPTQAKNKIFGAEDGVTAMSIH